MTTQVTVGAFKYNLASEEDYDESSSQSIDACSGMKVWECSFDLCILLDRACLTDVSLNVLELGCGHGLPGLVCLSKGYTVHFQDYSTDTIDRVCRKTVLLNFPDRIDNCTFSSGPWNQFKSNEKYDIIICSEGIYSTEHFDALREILKTCLRPETGVAYFAGKKYYFGCGGGTTGFAAYLGDVFTSEVVEKFQDGKSNIREILKIRCSRELSCT
jgi:Lysine methyltransferase